MPSKELSLIIQHIEQQDTDHFGKFYMYVSLLNTVSVRAKSFTENLPQYKRLLGSTSALVIGELTSDFEHQVSLYARDFVNLKPHAMNTLYNIAVTYFRKGRISDLIQIIDQMLFHLTAIQGRQSHNQSVHDAINFQEKKASLIEFIKQVSAFNQNLLSLVDCSCNTILGGVAIVAGLVIMLASVFSLVPTILGLGLMIGGAYTAYSFANPIDTQMKQVEKQLNQLTQKAGELTQDKSLFSGKNHLAFFGSVIQPIPYSAVTACEQLMFNPEQQKKLGESREGLDALSQSFTA